MSVSISLDTDARGGAAAAQTHSCGHKHAAAGLVKTPGAQAGGLCE